MKSKLFVKLTFVLAVLFLTPTPTPAAPVAENCCDDFSLRCDQICWISFGQHCGGWQCTQSNGDCVCGTTCEGSLDFYCGA